MTAIYKYQIPIQEKCTIELPAGARIIRVGEAAGFHYLWAEVKTDPEHPKENRYLEMYKTGQPIVTPSENLNYLGTCKLFVGQELCLYVFENYYESVLDRKL